MTKAEIQTLINTNLASGGGSAGGVNSAKHKEVATAILNYASSFLGEAPIAKGTVTVGDVSSTKIISVVFAEPVNSVSYNVSGSLVSAGNANNDTTCYWTVRNKSVSGFTLIVKESGGFAQALQFDYVVFSVLEAVDDVFIANDNSSTTTISPLLNDILGVIPTNITSINTTGFNLGSLSIDSNRQTIQLVPNLSTGTSNIGYTIQDASGKSDSANISITIPASSIEAVNDSFGFITGGDAQTLIILNNDNLGYGDASITGLNTDMLDYLNIAGYKVEVRNYKPKIDPASLSKTQIERIKLAIDMYV
jgi:hypothetical protein